MKLTGSNHHFGAGNHLFQLYLFARRLTYPLKTEGEFALFDVNRKGYTKLIAGENIKKPY